MDIGAGEHERRLERFRAAMGIRTFSLLTASPVVLS